MVESLSTGDELGTSGSFLHRAIGNCPVVTVTLQGVEVNCLLDTGAQVSTVTESFYTAYLAEKCGLMDVGGFIQLAAANGTDIPFVGYMELELGALDCTFPSLGFLVVKDPQEDQMKARKHTVPGVLGSNVFRDMCQNLPKNCSTDTTWQTVLSLYCETRVTTVKCSRVRVAGKQPVLIPAWSLQVVEGTVKPSENSYTAIIEEVDVSMVPFQTGIRLGPSLVKVDVHGRVPMQVANFSNEDVYLHPRTPVGILSPAEAEPLVDVVVKGRNEAVVVKSSSTCASEVDEKQTFLTKVDIGDGLDSNQKDSLETLLVKYSNVFSTSEDDIGFCDAVEHRIETEDNVPVKVPHRRIPPHHWSEVREYLRSALDTGVIRESSSPYASPVVLVRKKDGKLCWML